jgi:DNA-binding winged helix-turn-helix (wHTH) protein
MQKKSKENQSSSDGSYRFGEFDLSPSERQLHRRGKVVALSPKAFDALLLFVRNAERLVRREQLIDALWPDTHVTEANLTNVVVALRKVLGRQSIQTVSKFGYRFCMPVVGEPGIQQATYTTFLQAKELAVVRSLDSMSRARDLFSLCVADDPGFAAAWAWLGRCSAFLEKFKHGSSVNLDLAQAALRRALAINPHLACAHQFYTTLQIDLGESRSAALRLVDRILVRGDEPESYAGLVQALRVCGLLDQSIAAHDRATALDPAIVTSVPHTHFLRCDYHAALDTYAGTRYYLDAAAWASLGDSARASSLLRDRLPSDGLSARMSGLMISLQSALEGRRDDTIGVVAGFTYERDPEVLFYLARHCAMVGASSQAIELLQRARSGGFTCCYALQHDNAFDTLRQKKGFQREAGEWARIEQSARRELEKHRLHELVGRA